MIEFDIKKLHQKLLNVTKISMLGNITYIDDNGEEKNLMGNKSFFTQVSKTFGITNFRKTKKMSFLYYDNVPLSIDYLVLIMINEDERVKLEQSWNGGFLKFISNLENSLKDEYFKDLKFYIDGKYLYYFKTDDEGEIKYKALSKSKDDLFHLTACKSLNLQNINSSLYKNNYRQVIIYKAKNKNGEYETFVSPTIKSIKHKFKDDDKNQKSKVDFDKINENFEVNLNFLLDAAKIIGGIYGYEATEFLNIEKTLIELKTVNLYKLQSHIINITTIDKNVLQCAAWMLGFYVRNKDLNNALKFRDMFSKLFSTYLISKYKIKGITGNLKDVYHNGVSNVEQKSINDMENDFNKLKDITEIENNKFEYNKNSYDML